MVETRSRSLLSFDSYAFENARMLLTVLRLGTLGSDLTTEELSLFL